MKLHFSLVEKYKLVQKSFIAMCVCVCLNIWQDESSGARFRSRSLLSYLFPTLEFQFVPVIQHDSNVHST